jgi:hypothetical protein
MYQTNCLVFAIQIQNPHSRMRDLCIVISVLYMWVSNIKFSEFVFDVGLDSIFCLFVFLCT